MSDSTQGPPGGVRLYHRPMSYWWWLHNRAYFNFIIRELTCVFVGAFAVLTLLQIRALGSGSEAFAEFAGRLRTPGFVVFNAVGVAALILHTVTWFKAVPTTMIVRVGETRVPGRVLIGALYVGWIVVSGIVAWILLGQ